MGISTLVTSGKGGAGKSTISVAVGQALSQRGRRTLLIDCDAGLRSLDRMTGIDAELVYDISDVVKGRCAPSHAIYECGQRHGLFMMPAPALYENAVAPKVMRRLVSLLKEHFDHVILDSPAGVGMGFRAAAVAADRAVVVCNPDPVCIRSSKKVGDILRDREIKGISLVINRLNLDFFEAADSFADLDAVIDTAGIQLLGVVPEDFDFAGATLRGERISEDLEGMKAASRVAGRLEGEDIPVALKEKKHRIFEGGRG